MTEDSGEEQEDEPIEEIPDSSESEPPRPASNARKRQRSLTESPLQPSVRRTTRSRRVVTNYDEDNVDEDDEARPEL